MSRNLSPIHGPRGVEARMSLPDLALGVLVTVIWGSNFSVIEVGLRNLDPFLLAALRFVCSALPLVFFLRRPRNVSLVALAGYGVIFGVGLWWVVNVAMFQGLSPGIASLVLQFSAFFTIGLSAVLLGERIGALQVAGMTLSLLGLVAIIRLSSGTATTLGIGLVLLAAVAWSVCNLIVKVTRPGGMLAFVVWSSLFSAPVLMALTWLSEGPRPFVELVQRFNAAAAFSVFFQAYITTVFGYMAWNNLMKKYPAATVAPLSLIVPVAGLVTSWLVFDERLAPGMWLGIVTVLAGIAVFVNAGRLEGAVARARAG